MRSALSTLSLLQPGAVQECCRASLGATAFQTMCRNAAVSLGATAFQTMQEVLSTTAPSPSEATSVVLWDSISVEESIFAIEVHPRKIDFLQHTFHA